MKLLYITKQLPFGTDEAFIYAELNDHLAHGCEVTIAPVNKGVVVHTSGAALLNRTLAAGLLNRQILWGFLCETLARPIAVFGTLLSTIDPSAPKLIPRNLAVWAKGVWLAREARRRGIEHIHVHWIAVPGTMGLIASRLSGIPMSITAHRYDIAQGNLIREKFDAASFVRAIDGPGAAELAAHLRPEQKRPVIIRMGVEIPEGHVTLPDGPLPQLKAIIGARLSPKKGHETLFRAIARARSKGVEVAIDVVGEGPLHGTLTALVQELGIADLVHFKGAISHQALIDQLTSGAFQLGILPSVTAADGDKEGIPVFLMESMGAGLPVISTPNGGIVELIDEGSGILVPEYDVEALADALVKIALDGELRQRLAAAGRVRVETEFAIVACARQLREHFAAAASAKA